MLFMFAIESRQLRFTGRAKESSPIKSAYSACSVDQSAEFTNHRARASQRLTTSPPTAGWKPSLPSFLGGFFAAADCGRLGDRNAKATLTENKSHE